MACSMPLIPGKEVARQSQGDDGAVEEAAARDFAGGGQGDELPPSELFFPPFMGRKGFLF